MLETAELHQSNEAVGCETNDSSEKCAVTVMQTDNVGRQRKWDKKHYCFYCDEPQAKLPRHLQSRHKEEREVVEIASETDVSARKKLLLYIRNIGNHRHNCQVLREGKGVLIIVYRPNHEASPHAYGPCIHCYGYYVRLDLWRHQCPLKPALPAQTDGSSRRGRVRGRVANKSDLLKPPPAGVSFQLNKVLSLPDTVQRVTKLSRLFLSLERGNLVSQHGKSLEELHVTGEGFSSDDDSSDSGDSCDPALEDSVDDRRPPTQTDPAPKDRQVKRRQFKRRPWTAQEKKDVTEGLQRFFLLKKIPGKRDIESSCPVALQTRTWRNIKDFCRNTMTLQQI
ncbi:uncharacterized protein [Asterias amurensis]|uniref:uncharacterized protein isoform X1 n=1 Tax=Asterias amurensis TaxID=7602 RepID=UPI003AB4B230